MHRLSRLTVEMIGLLAIVATLCATALPATRTLAAGPTITVAHNIVGAGDTVSVTGAGFAPSGTVVVSAMLNESGTVKRVATTAQSDAGGAFSASFTVPASTSTGMYTVKARDFQNHTASHALTVLPVVYLKPGQAVPAVPVVAGRGFFVRGTGFKPGEKVTVTAAFPTYAGFTANVSKGTYADSKGNLASLFLKTPANARIGTDTLTAAGQSQDKAAATLKVIYHPSLSLGANSQNAHPGQQIQVNGRGYVPNSHVRIAITIGPTGGTQQTLTQDVTANASGGFSAALTLPPTVRKGKYSVSGTDLTTNLKAVTSLDVSLEAALQIQPSAVFPGESVVARGSGFSANVQVTIKVNVPLYGGGTHALAFVAHTDGNGAFTTRLSLPPNAAAGSVKFLAVGPNTQKSATIQIRHLNAAIHVSPVSAIPGAAVQVTGQGYRPHDQVSIQAVVPLVNGSKTTVTATATTGADGKFSATLKIPANASGGALSLTAKSASTGRAPVAKFTVVALAPSVVVVPAMSTPGTPVTISGFGFASGQHIELMLQNQAVGSATTDSAGKFSVKVTIPANLATGQYTVMANGASGRQAHVALNVQRAVSTHFYFASEYTGKGYHEYLAFLNPTTVKAHVTINYQLTNGTVHTKSFGINPHSRFTEDVNADLGFHVSASAAVSSDVAIVGSRVVYHGSDGAMGPGVRKPSTTWYFANGNTSSKYREYLAVENPGKGPVQVAVHFFPTHHPAFTVYRNMPATSRTTFKVNSYVHKDAVGALVTANGPIVVNRTIFIRHGMTSKIGVTSPERSWYFAAGPKNANAHHWIGLINPANRQTYVTLHAYGASGAELGTVKGWVKPYGRVGYLINKIAHRVDTAVVVTASAPIVVEQTTYAGRLHQSSTDTFGVIAPQKSWLFAAVNTAGGQRDVLDLFNPNLDPAPIVVQFMTTSGSVTQRTYVVGPLQHSTIHVASIEPNATLGIAAGSSLPFVALNRLSYGNGSGAMTSFGVHQ